MHCNIFQLYSCFEMWQNLLSVLLQALPGFPPNLILGELQFCEKQIALKEVLLSDFKLENLVREIDMCTAILKWCVGVCIEFEIARICNWLFYFI